MDNIDTGYFRKLLFNFLCTNEPDLSGDTKLINERAEAAFLIYESVLAKDKSAALELAKMRLFEGLELSVYNFVLGLVCKYFNRIPDKSHRALCLKLLPECKKIYDSFSFTNADTIGGNYYQMIDEVLKVIKRYADEDDLC